MTVQETFNQAGINDSYPVSVPRSLSVKRIVSVCPMPLRKAMKMGPGEFVFEIPAQARNSYHVISVADSYQWIAMGFDDLGPSNPTPSMGQAPLPAIVIAQSLVTEWSQSVGQRGSKGVAIVPDGMEEDSPEFRGLLAQLNAQVRELAEWAIRDANDMHADGKSKLISDAFHRTLASWFLGTDGAAALPWFQASTITNMKKCIACAGSIEFRALSCKHCGMDLIKFFKEHDFQQSDDAFVYSFINRVKMPLNTEGTSSTPDAPPAFKVSLPENELPNDVRAAAVDAMTGEQKASMQRLSGQAKKDAYIIENLPALCRANEGLRNSLKAKRYVISDAE